MAFEDIGLAHTTRISPSHDMNSCNHGRLKDTNWILILNSKFLLPTLEGPVLYLQWHPYLEASCNWSALSQRAVFASVSWTPSGYVVPDFCMNDDCKNRNRTKPKCYRISRPYLEFVRRRHALQPPMLKLPCMKPSGFSFESELLFCGDLVPLASVSTTYVLKEGAAQDSYATML
ncbi:hypothetical protein VNO77_31275 [Canavalia gladiata]|uniref:Uncharacterized protein n=1 Tax=Canavalia gladiata TaxID=3824 RepID=A0AAN9KP36_CANGL